MTQFWVPGPPVSQGSMTIGWSGGRPFVGEPYVRHVESKDLKEWRGHVAMLARNAGLRPVKAVPIRVRASFCLERPKSHYRANGELKPDAPRFRPSTPDVDKVTRALLDALKGVAYKDDAQVVWLEVMKPYALDRAGEGTAVVIEVLE